MWQPHGIVLQKINCQVDKDSSECSMYLTIAPDIRLPYKGDPTRKALCLNRLRDVRIWRFFRNAPCIRILAYMQL